MGTRSESESSVNAAIVGFIFALPFLLTNFIVALRIEPFYSFLGSFPAVRNSPIFPLLLLLLFPIGAFVAARPMLQKRKIYVFNIIVAVILLVIFLVLFIGLGEDMYKCEVLQIPNCD